jgi:hypothetical protein
MAKIISRKSISLPMFLAMSLAAAFLLAPASLRAQAEASKSAPPTCGTQIPTGVRVVRMPDTDQRSVAISDFSISASKSAQTYDLSMQIKNGTNKWCITSLALTYVFGDARGQEWTANEYPAVMNFKAQPDLPPPSKPGKASASLNAPAPNVGMPPGKDEKRMVFNVYDYIQPRPTGFFDGFHLISAQIDYCMGYAVSEGK